MKILAIAATPFFSDRGNHIRIFNEARYLKKLGAEVRLLTYHIGADVAGVDAIRIRGPRWYKKTSPGFSWGKVWLDIKLIFLCRRQIKNFQPDVIHAHLYEGMGIGYIAKSLVSKRVPLVIDLQSDLNEEFKSYNKNNFIARRIFVWLSRRLINRCDWLVLSSEKLIAPMQTALKRKERIAVVKDGVDLDLFNDIRQLTEAERDGIREIEKWKGASRLLIYVGGLSDNKGVRELLKAFTEFHGSSRQISDTGWKLLLGGYGDDEEGYRQYVKKNSMDDQVYFAGKVGYFSLPYYLAIADVEIDPKRDSMESSGKLMNLMAAGLPIVCFENEFNWQRLGVRGFYLADMRELGVVLGRLSDANKRDYDNLEQLSEEQEARKLINILKSAIK